jgi:hypothetical protein
MGMKLTSAERIARSQRAPQFCEKLPTYRSMTGRNSPDCSSDPFEESRILSSVAGTRRVILETLPRCCHDEGRFAWMREDVSGRSPHGSW